MTWLAQNLHLKTFLDFYKLQQKDFRSHSGWGMLNENYAGSVVTAIVSLFHEFAWNWWKFSKCFVSI